MIENRWEAFGTSIFSVMSEAALKFKAVNLAQGFPSFDGPEEIKEAAIAAIKGGFNQYAPATGIPALRELLSHRQKQTTGIEYNRDTEVTVFSGATEAIFSTILGLCGPGDEIVTFEPFYDSYPASAFAAHAKLKCVELQAPNWTFTKQQLAQAITEKTKMILVNTPHNPTGKVFTKEELGWIRDAAVAHDLIVVTDEVYEAIVFKPAVHTFLATMDGMRDRTVTISSTSKTFSMTGWKVGYIFAQPELTKIIRAVHQFVVFCSATPLQYGMVAALKLEKDYFEQFTAEYLERRDLLLEILKEAKFKVSVPDGSYFILADYSQHSQEIDRRFAMWMTEHAKVATIPISGFFSNTVQAEKKLKYLRFAFCKDLKTLESARENFKKFGFV